MPSAPDISIVIPVYNRSQTIARAVRSALDQTFLDCEIIVVDDGSVDDTVAVVERLGASNVRILKQPRNGGAASARNAGIRAARGRWIAFLDSDDTWRPDKLRRQMLHLDNRSSKTLGCVTGYDIHKAGQTKTVVFDLTPQKFYNEIVFGCSVSPGSTLLIRRDAFDEVGLFAESIYRLEDWEWLLRYTERYDLAFVPEPLVDVYVGTLSKQQALERQRMVLAALEYINDKCRPNVKSSLRRIKLSSSLYVERASAMYRSGRFCSAVGCVLISLCLYPFRNLSFFRMLWRSVF